ncbi:hypothetical protein CI238_10417, partial [Colletotrichum incanum]
LTHSTPSTGSCLVWMHGESAACRLAWRSRPRLASIASPTCKTCQTQATRSGNHDDKRVPATSPSLPDGHTTSCGRAGDSHPGVLCPYSETQARFWLRWTFPALCPARRGTPMCSAFTSR